jgi:hypothetical protein
MMSLLSCKIYETFAYSSVYPGPSPPSGQVQVILLYGSFMSQVLQCRQLDGLSLSCGAEVFSSNSISYTFPGQNLVQGL